MGLEPLPCGREQERTSGSQEQFRPKYPPYMLASFCAVILFPRLLPRLAISVDVYPWQGPPALRQEASSNPIFLMIGEGEDEYRRKRQTISSLVYLFIFS